jgi:hypothetical protein
METLEELKKWVETLSVAEKRFIKLLGKAKAGNSESQQLELLDWLNKAEGKKATLPAAKIMNNLPTVSIRLKDLILDGLRLLHKETNVDALLRTTLDEIATLFDRKLYHVVARQLKRTKKVALEHCRYAIVLLAIEWEQKMVLTLSPGDALEQLERLREEEVAASTKLSELQRVRYLHDTLRARTRVSFPRDAETLRELQHISESDVVERLSLHGAYLDQALAVNVLGIKDICEGNPKSALERYEKLLNRWNAHPQWQRDQSSLLLLICSQYQVACFYSPITASEVRNYLTQMPDFKAFSPEAALDFQRILYRNQLHLTLNTGNFEAVVPLIAEIDHWLQQDTTQLSQDQTLLFLHNLAVAEFLQGRSAAANRFVQRILNLSNRKVRQDVREFAIVLQAVLQFELGEYSLTEYLTRAGKRHFSKKPLERGFELAVLNYLERAMGSQPEALKTKELQQFIAVLEGFASQLPSGIPIIGLTEIRLWAEARQSGRPLKEVFLEAVRQNLEAMGG